MGFHITQRIDELNIETEGIIKSITIRFEGSFVGKILGNTRSKVFRNKINIKYLEDIPEVIMIYKGNMKIFDVSGTNELNKPIPCSFSLINDEVQRIKAQLDESTQKWEDYNKTNVYYNPMISMIEYIENNVIKYQEARGNRLLSLPLRQRTMLNKIRGNYGFK